MERTIEDFDREIEKAKGEIISVLDRVHPAALLLILPGVIVAMLVAGKRSDSHAWEGLGLMERQLRESFAEAMGGEGEDEGRGRG